MGEPIINKENNFFAMAVVLTERMFTYLRMPELRYEITQRGHELPPNPNREDLIDVLREHPNSPYRNDLEQNQYADEKTEILVSARYLLDKIDAGILTGDVVHRFLAISAHVINRILRLHLADVEDDLLTLLQKIRVARKSIIEYRAGIENQEVEDLENDSIPLPGGNQVEQSALSEAEFNNGLRRASSSQAMGAIQSSLLPIVEEGDIRDFSTGFRRGVNLNGRFGSNRQPSVNLFNSQATQTNSNDQHTNGRSISQILNGRYISQPRQNAAPPNSSRIRADACNYSNYRPQNNANNRPCPASGGRMPNDEYEREAYNEEYCLRPNRYAFTRQTYRPPQLPIHSWPFRFSGDKRKDKLSPSDFLSAVEEYADSENLTDRELLLRIHVLLEGNATVWYRGMKNYLFTYEDFRNALLVRFGDSNVLELKAEIFNKRQEPDENTVSFIDSFRMLLERLHAIEPMTPEAQFDAIMQGLCPEVQIHVRTQGIAKNVHELYEFVLQNFKSGHTPNYNWRLRRVRVNEMALNSNYNNSDTVDAVSGNDSDTENALEMEALVAEARKQKSGRRGPGRKIVNQIVNTGDTSNGTPKLDEQAMSNKSCPFLCRHDACEAKRPALLADLKRNKNAIDNSNKTTELQENAQLEKSESQAYVCFKCNGIGHGFRQCPNKQPHCVFCHTSGVYTNKCQCEEAQKLYQKVAQSSNPNSTLADAILTQAKRKLTELRSNSAVDCVVVEKHDDSDLYYTPESFRTDAEELFSFPSVNEMESCSVTVNPIYIPDLDGRPHCDVNIGDERMTGLLDTGSQCTLIGENHLAQSQYLQSLKKFHSKITVSTADKTVHVPLCLLKVPYRMRMGDSYTEKIVNTHVVAVEMTRPIFGVDFQLKFGIGLLQMVNVLDTKPAKTVLVQHDHELTEEQQRELDAAIALFPFSSNDGELNCTTKIEHKIELTDNKPIYVKPKAFTPETLAKAKPEIERLLQRGIIETVTSSEWNLPILCVDKPDGRVRIVLDGRRLNVKTVKNKYPQMSIERIYSRLKKIKYITAIDVSDAFLQIGLAEECRDMTTFTVPGLGRYRYKKMCPGLTNACATLCTLVDGMFCEIDSPNIYCYLDDFLLINEDFDKHIADLKFMAKRFRDVQLTISRQKSIFCKSQLRWLGQILSCRGMEIDPDRIEAVSKLKRPSTERDIRSILGLTGWFRRFIQNYAGITIPLSNLLKKTDDGLIYWNSDAENSFNQLKIVLTTAPILRPADYNRPFTIDASSSDLAISAMLSQHVDGELRIIAYMSAKLPPAQQRYSQPEKNILAIIYACDKWRMFIDGKRTKVITNTPSVVWLMKNREATGRLTRYALRLQTFDLEFQNRKTKREFVPVDVLCESAGDEVKMLDVKALNIFDDITLPFVHEITDATDNSVNSVDHQKSVKDNEIPLYQIEEEIMSEIRFNMPHRDFICKDGFVQAYTDGACERNGEYGAKAGIGVWFNDGHVLNASEPLVGIPTNNRAEIHAAIKAIETALENGITALAINSDSKFLIHSVTSWMSNWKVNGWYTKSGKPIVNRDDFEKLNLLLEKNPNLIVQWKYVPAHSDVYGNEKADRLAKDGAQWYELPRPLLKFADEFPDDAYPESTYSDDDSSDTQSLNVSMVSIESAGKKKSGSDRNIDKIVSLAIENTSSGAFDDEVESNHCVMNTNYYDYVLGNHERDTGDATSVIDAREAFIVDVTEIAKTQCEWYSKLLQEVKENGVENYKIEDEILYFKPPRNIFKTDIKWKIVIPSDMIAKVIAAEHDATTASHPGFYRTLYRLRSKYYFCKMYTTVCNYVRECTICRQSKASNENTRVPYGGERTPRFVGQTLSCDFMGPLTTSKFPSKNRWIFVITCKLSKFVWLKAMKTATAENVIKFIDETIRMQFGFTPQDLICDNGSQFDGKIFRQYCAENKIRMLFTPIRHPQANNTENVNHVIGNAIRSVLISKGIEQELWDSHLCEIAYAINSTPHTQTLVAPFVAVFGRNAIHDGSEYDRLYKGEDDDIDIDELKAKRSAIAHEIIVNLHKAYLTNQKQYNKRATTRSFKVDDVVYLKNFKPSKKGEKYMSKLAPRKEPYSIVEVLSGNRYVLRKLYGKRNETVVYSATDIYTY